MRENMPAIERPSYVPPKRGNILNYQRHVWTLAPYVVLIASLRCEALEVAT